MREEHDPVVTNKLMKVNGAGCRVGLEVGRNGPKAETACVRGDVSGGCPSFSVMAGSFRVLMVTYGPDLSSCDDILNSESGSVE